MSRSRLHQPKRRWGFTLVEMSVATAVGSMVIAGMAILFVSFLRSYNTTSLMRNSSSSSSLALERMVYGVSTNLGLRAADASTVAVTFPSNGWRISYNTNLVFQYSVSASNITDQSGKIICRNVVGSTLNFYTNACRLSVSVAERGGGRTLTNTMSTFVGFRN